MTQPVPGIWLRPERSRRGPAPEYSRDQIAEAAVRIADADGLPAVTMRSVAAAIGAGPASLYRYFVTRDELVALMVDLVIAEIRYDDGPSGDPVRDLVGLAQEARRVHLHHRWLVEAQEARTDLGPRSVDYLEHALAAMSPVRMDGPSKLVVVAVLSGVVRLLVRAELQQQDVAAGRAEQQAALEAYLVQMAAAQTHPHLAAALAGAPADAQAVTSDELFEPVVTRIVRGLLTSPETLAPDGTAGP